MKTWTYYALLPYWNTFIGTTYGLKIKNEFYSKIMHKMSNRNCDLIKNFVVHFFFSSSFSYSSWYFSWFFFSLLLVAAISISKSNIYYVNQNLCMSPLAVKCRLCARHWCVYGVVRFRFTCIIIWYTQRPKKCESKKRRKRYGRKNSELASILRRRRAKWAGMKNEVRDE